MKLHVQCRKCREYFDLKRSYLTRPDLIADIGEYFNLQCNHCFKNVRFHANDVKAYKSASGKMIVNVFGIGVLVLVTMAFWDKGYITNLGLILGGGILAANNLSLGTSNEKAFNDYRVTWKPDPLDSTD